MNLSGISTARFSMSRYEPFHLLSITLSIIFIALRCVNDNSFRSSSVGTIGGCGAAVMILLVSKGGENLVSVQTRDIVGSVIFSVGLWVSNVELFADSAGIVRLNVSG